MDALIKIAEDAKTINKVYEFIKKYTLNYPDYFQWLNKTRDQLLIKEKQCFYAIVAEEVVGSLIFQKYKGNDDYIEIKNFRIAANCQKSVTTTSEYTSGMLAFSSGHYLSSTFYIHYVHQSSRLVV